MSMPESLAAAVAAIPARTASLRITGPDACAFLHAQLASDVRALPAGRWQWSAWLDAQGRVRALLQLARTSDDTYLTLPRGGDAHSLQAALARYVLRAQVRMQVQPVGLHAGAPLADGAIMIGAQSLALGMGAHRWQLHFDEHAVADSTTTDAAAWRAEIEAGWPWLPAVALDALTPPALGLEHLAAVAFDKGCYPGQEIAARLHFRGGNKRRLVSLRAPTAALHEHCAAHADALLPLARAELATDTLLLAVLNTASAQAASFEPWLLSTHAP